MSAASTKDRRARRMVAVIGGAEESAAVLDRAREVGRRLAEAGEVVLTGGRGGVMQAASEGAAEAGGTVVALLPSKDVADANPFVELALATGCGDARNAMIANSAAGFVAVGGSYGTLSEIAFALERGKPVVGLGACERLNRAAGALAVEAADSPADAVERLLARLR